MATIAEALTAAIHYQRSRQFASALALTRQILSIIPDHSEALYLSALSIRDGGDPVGGYRRLRLSLAARPDFPEAWVHLAATFRSGGQPATALAAYDRALRLTPESIEAGNGMANLLVAMGRSGEALTLWRRLAASHPERADIANAVGNALQGLGKWASADAAYRRALAAEPAYAAAWANRGAALRSLERAPPASESSPAEHGALDLALLCQRLALRVDPFFAAAHDGLGQTWLRLGRTGDALPHHRRAIALQPDFTGAYANLGNALLGQNAIDAAVAAYRRAVTLAPAMPDPRRNLGIALLLGGHFAEGWREYEWRLACADAQTAPIPRPCWTGEPLDGRTILLHAEQGLGDALHFARYIPLVAAQGGRVALCAPPILERLIGHLPGVVRFIPGGQPFSLSGIDLHAPLMSLPFIMGTTIANIPAPVAYLAPPLAETLRWRRRLAALERLATPITPPDGDQPEIFQRVAVRVGVVWAGSPTHGNDRNRSLPLDALQLFAAIPGVRLVSLQKGPAADQLAARARAGDPLAGAILNPGDDIADFADTAAIAASLDLIICVDTSVAHLCGAIGRPTWVLLPFAPDWRWMLHRRDNPWYPTLRLFRQKTPGDWGPVLAEAATSLLTLTGS